MNKNSLYVLILTSLNMALCAMDSQDKKLTLTSYALIKACKDNKPNKALNLINQGTDPNITTKIGNNLAHIVAQSGAQETLLMLVAKETDIDFNAYNNNQETPLSIALRTNHLNAHDTVQTLLGNGADPNRPATKNMLTPLMIAAHLNNTQFMQTLLNAGANENVTIQGREALKIAFQQNNPEAIDLLLQYGATTQEHLIQLAFTKNRQPKANLDNDKSIKMLHVLKKHGVNLNHPITMNYKMKPLVIHLLHDTHNLLLIEKLIMLGATVDQKEIQRLYSSIIETQYHPYAQLNHNRINHINLLITKLVICLQHTKEIYKMPNGNSILVQAAKDKMIHLVHKITINCPRYHGELNTENEHALHYIATWRRCPCTNKNCTTNKNILQTIDALSAYVNEKDTEWRTPLMLAQNPTVILRLLLNNAHVNTQDKDGNTPIMYAIKRSNPVSVKLLERALFLKNIQGENHVDIQKTIYAQLQTSLTEVVGMPHVYDAVKNTLENSTTINDLLQHKQTEKTRSIQKETRKKVTNQLNLNPRDILSRQLGMRPKKLWPHNNNNNTNRFHVTFRPF